MYTSPPVSEISTMDWVTFWIAVIGFALSVYNFVEDLANNARNISVSVKHLYQAKECAVLLVEITNHSHQNISITYGKLIGSSGEFVDFGETRRRIFEYAHPESRGKTGEDTVIFPVNIDPLRSERVLLLTESILPESGCRYRVVLGSSRGKISKTVEIPVAHEDIASMLQHLS